MAIGCAPADGARTPRSAAAGDEGEAQIVPLTHGEPFPAATYRNLNPNAGGTIDLSQALGSKPVILFYWIVGHERAEQAFRDLEELTSTISADQLALYGVAVPRPNADAAKITERIRALGFRSPVIEDEGFVIGKQLEVARVPHIALVDREGRLQLSNAASLRQQVTPDLDIEGAILRFAESGTLDTYGKLDRYFPVTELAGRPCPDFSAPMVASKVEQRLSSLMDDEKLNLLIFWSVDCPHCRQSLPEINSWLRQNRDAVNVVSAAKVTSESDRRRTSEFCDVNGFDFPTLAVDSDQTELFHVTSTPTILVIRPDGVIDSAVIDAHGEFGEIIEQKKREILGS